MNPGLTTTSRWIFRRAGWRESTVLLAAAWLVPVLVHWVPWTGPRPLGVYVLPIFWTTFVATYFYGMVPGVLVGLVTPGLNLLLTGLPVSPSVAQMSLEVVLFAFSASLLMKRWPSLLFAAPLAYVMAKAAVIALAFVTAAAGEPENPLHHLARSMQNGASGLAILAGINALLAGLSPQLGADGKE